MIFHGPKEEKGREDWESAGGRRIPPSFEHCGGPSLGRAALGEDDGCCCSESPFLLSAHWSAPEKASGVLLRRILESSRQAQPGHGKPRHCCQQSGMGWGEQASEGWVVWLKVCFTLVVTLKGLFFKFAADLPFHPALRPDFLISP